MSFITPGEVAARLGISAASVMNWQKHGYLTASGNGLFATRQVDELERKIRQGELERLRSRANKSHSREHLFPLELLQDPSRQQELESLCRTIRAAGVPAKAALFYLALGCLSRRGLIPAPHRDSLTERHPFQLPDRPHLARSLNRWQAHLTMDVPPSLQWTLVHQPLPDQEDMLGILYQALRTEGSKARDGAYYTPPGLVTTLAQATAERHDLSAGKILDPCCGSGQFLLAFASQVNDPCQLCGLDLDPLALRIAGINLRLRFPDRDFEPELYCCDALREAPFDTPFDLVATNPPWGYHFRREQQAFLSRRWPGIHSGESSSYFLRRGLEFLAPGGELLYLLPEAILTVKKHSDIRRYLMEHTSPLSIEHRSRVFKNVFSSVIILRLKNSPLTAPPSPLQIRYQNRSFSIDSHRFKKNSDCRFDIQISPEDAELINKVYNTPHLFLKGQASWGLGIVTGNNNLYVHKQKTDTNYEPVFRGRDIHPFRFTTPEVYLQFKPENFQQVAKEKIYRNPEKLVYKFISQRLIFARDTSGRLTLNSANILIPAITGYPASLIAAFFNSSLYQFLYQKQFNSLKVLRSHLEQLPLPILSACKLEEFRYLAAALETGRQDMESLDKAVFDYFGFDKNQRDYINAEIH